MLIFLDSNIICADYKMKSPSFEVAQTVGTIVLGQRLHWMSKWKTIIGLRTERR